jgi:ssDNA-binding Zn-finger/Zn-ribbon topoisomerase 1
MPQSLCAECKKWYEEHPLHLVGCPDRHCHHVKRHRKKKVEVEVEKSEEKEVNVEVYE